MTDAQSAPTPRRRERFMGLEWLRFGLGLYLVAFHTLHAYQPIRSWSHYVTDLGFFATSTFFVLSGFLLTHVYLDARSNHVMREPARSFWVKRFSNLYPIHIGSLLLAILMAQMVGWLALTPADAATTYRFVAYDINRAALFPGETHHIMSYAELFTNLGLNAVMLQAWNPYYLTFNPPSWSISALFFFYLWFPWLAPKLMRLRRPAIGLAITLAVYVVPALIVIALTNYDTPETGILHRNPIVRMPEFIAGILLYAIYARRRATGSGLSVATGGILGVLIVVSFVGGTLLLTFGSAAYYLLHDGLLLPACLAAVYLAAFVRPAGSERINDWAVRLGGAALPMFALHIPLFTAFTRLEKILAGQPSLCLAGQWRPCFDAAGQATLSVWAYPLYLVLTIAACVVFQQRFVRGARHLIEPPLMRLVMR
ncbi:acyltransferase [Salinisphaera sp. Q1T1-3]|uniref:acyltransferase family protein n=1 Tax=Salinisphaera sp. Q1T1-3 TaxID=2321229 RepID=UPI001F3B908F|nr:acyltransferase [Salinisphaera sp. Q1T1-3]